MRGEMISISSHRSLRRIKMRVLILSAFFACAAAAPSHLYAPVPYAAVAIPAIVPTISPGDIHAAAIDTQVQIADSQILAEDAARAAADKANEIAEQAAEVVNEKSVIVDQANEQNAEAVWSAEEKKWQAINALQTAEAQIDGAVASSAPILAKNAVGVIPYAAGIQAPIVAQIPPVVYSGLVAPFTGLTQTVQSSEKSEATVKSTDSVQVEAQKSEVKSEKTEAGEAVVKTAETPVSDKPGVPLIAPVGVTNVYGYNLVAPGVAPIFGQPLLKYAGVPQFHGVVAPTLIKTVW